MVTGNNSLLSTMRAYKTAGACRLLTKLTQRQIAHEFGLARRGLGIPSVERTGTFEILFG
jgi:hypothetical protein